MASLNTLPGELLSEITAILSIDSASSSSPTQPSSLWALSLTSRRLHQFANPLLYRHVQTSDIESLSYFLRTLRRSPHLGELVHALHWTHSAADVLCSQDLNTWRTIRPWRIGLPVGNYSWEPPAQCMVIKEFYRSVLAEFVSAVTPSAFPKLQSIVFEPLEPGCFDVPAHPVRQKWFDAWLRHPTSLKSFQVLIMDIECFVVRLPPRFPPNLKKLRVPAGLWTRQFMPGRMDEVGIPSSEGLVELELNSDKMEFVYGPSVKMFLQTSFQAGLVGASLRKWKFNVVHTDRFEKSERKFPAPNQKMLSRWEPCVVNGVPEVNRDMVIELFGKEAILEE